MPSHLLSRHTFAKPIAAEHTVLCSPHELVAIVTYTHDIVVYRLNGQIAFTIKNSQDEDDIAGGEEPLRVTRMTWSPDGRRLAIAWNDGNWRIHEAERGEAIFQGTVRSEEDLAEETSVVGMTWENYGNNLDASAETSPIADLPKLVSLLDITSVLPRLSALPSHGLRSSAESTKFSNQAATDSVFSPSTRQVREGCVEILLLYTSAGQVRVMLNGTSHTGTAKCSGIDSRAIYAAGMSNAYVIDADSPAAVGILSLPIAELSGTVLHITSHSATQMIALLQYMQRAVQCIAHDYTTGLSQPNRFIKSISNTLEDNMASNSTLTSALLQLAMTGQFHADLLEWLTDIVKDTGLKRWDASIITMYTSVQTHLHEHLIPALDRITIAVTRLRGLARLHQGGETFAPREDLFTAVLKCVDTTRAVVLKAIEVCVSECALWRVFSRWLKVQIEVAAAGPNTKDAIETEERESLGIDYGAVLKYIRTVLETGSGLKPYADDKHDLRAQVKNIADTAHAALADITAWQGRLFTSTELHQLVWHGQRILDLRSDISNDNGREQLKALSTHDSGLVLSTYTAAASLDATATQTTHDLSINAVHAAFYDAGDQVVALAQTVSEDSKPDLVCKNLTSEVTLHHDAFDTGLNTQVESMLVAGRRGKEFMVVIGKGCKSWAVHDLQSAILGATAKK